MQHLLGDAFSPLLVGALSDAVYRFFGHNQTINGTCDVGKGVSLEFALFTTVFVCAIGVAAFLALTLSVAADRKAVEQFSQCQGGGGGASSKEWEDQDDSDSDAFDHHSGLLSQAVREHMYSSINT
jgi:hypothetical protein